MKVALLLTGHMRCWQQVFPNTKQHLLDKYNPDIFIHTWDSEAYWDPHSQKGVTEGGPKLDVEAIRETYNPVHMVVDHYENFEQNLDRKSTRLNSSHTDISRMPSSA